MSAGRYAALFGLGTALSFGGGLCLGHAGVLSGPFYPFSDIAADILLADRTVDAPILHGHYSRLQLYHPGPLLLWSSWLCEALFGALLPHRYASHLLAVIALGAVFAGIIGAGFARLSSALHAGTNETVTGLLLLFSGLALLAIPGNPWPPALVALPFSGFVLWLALGWLGQARTLPLCTLCGAACVHLYLPVAPVVLLLWPVLALKRFHQEPRSFLPEFAVSAVIICFFAAPILFDALLYQGGNLAAILSAGASHLTRSTDRFAKLFQALSRSGMETLAIGLCGIAGAALLLLTGRRETATARRDVLIAGGATLFTLALTAFVAGSKLRGYALLSGGVVPLIWTSAGMNALLAPRRYQGQMVRFGAPAAALVILLASPFGRPTYAGLESLPRFLSALEDQPINFCKTGVFLGLERNAPWGIATGLALALDQRGTPFCLRAPGLPMVDRLGFDCPEIVPERLVRIVTAAQCGKLPACLYSEKGWGLALAPPVQALAVGTPLVFSPENAPRLLAIQTGGTWSAATPRGSWLRGDRATLTLPLRAPLPAGTNLVIRFRPSRRMAEAGKLLRISIGDAEVLATRLRPDGGWRTLRAPLPAADVGTQKLAVSFALLTPPETVANRVASTAALQPAIQVHSIRLATPATQTDGDQ